MNSILTLARATTEIPWLSVDGKCVGDIRCATGLNGLVFHIDNIGIPPLACIVTFLGHKSLIDHGGSNLNRYKNFDIRLYVPIMIGTSL